MYIFFPPELKFPLSDLIAYPLTDQDDDVDKGNSRVTALMEDWKCINYSYILKEGARYPYAGVAIYFRNREYINIANYQYLKIRIKTAVNPNVRILLRFYLDGFSREEAPLSYCYTEQMASLQADWLRLKITDFIIPDWWYRENHLSEIDLHDIPFYTRLVNIEIQNTRLMPLDTEEMVEVSGLVFEQSSSPFLLVIILTLLVLFIINLVLLLRLRLPAKGSVFTSACPTLASLKKTDAINHSEIETEKLLGFLQDNFTDPELSLKKVNNATGISVSKIPLILKNKMALSFKQYLNLLRITRAKELLSATDWQVKEVAFFLGFNSLTHFGRIFKELEGLSPYSYKKQNLKKSGKS
ncbi:MAG: helix-turn-helix transcriptional regulator [Spirochaetales bacterium]|nr:helix-turn-helix transcriptional regulator [Spirochaetales bacterium]